MAILPTASITGLVLGSILALSISSLQATFLVPVTIPTNPSIHEADRHLVRCPPFVPIGFWRWCRTVATPRHNHRRAQPRHPYPLPFPTRPIVVPEVATSKYPPPPADRAHVDVPANVPTPPADAYKGPSSPAPPSSTTVNGGNNTKTAVPQPPVKQN